MRKAADDLSILVYKVQLSPSASNKRFILAKCIMALGKWNSLTDYRRSAYANTEALLEAADNVFQIGFTRILEASS